MHMKMHRIFLLALACTGSVTALAQWQWTDKDGRKVFSDRAPPVDVPQSHILKQPHALPANAPPAAGADAQAPATALPATARSNAPATPKVAPASGIDKELQEKKAQAEAAEAARDKAAEAQRAAARADNCTRAQRAKATFASERPIRQTDAQGNVGILSAQERAAEVRRIQSIIDADCQR